MTIREIEALSGMTRANIRFYESEGLLTPNRMENGFRRSFPGADRPLRQAARRNAGSHARWSAF